MSGKKKIYISASQESTFDQCERKWGLNKIAGIEEPTKESQKVGTECHSTLENWLMNGVPPKRDTKAGAIVLPGIKYLPPIKTGECEMKFERDEKSPLGVDYTFLGYIDWIGKIDGVPYVLDHKTTKNIKAFALTEKTLPENIQALLYAMIGLDKFDCDEIGLRWVYYQTQGKKCSAVVDVRLSREYVETKFEDLKRRAAVMAAMKEAGDVEACTQNFEACGNYGGCFFKKDHCNLSPSQKIGAMMKTGKTLHERLLERMAKDGKGPLAEKMVEAAKAEPVEAEGINAPEAAEIDAKAKSQAQLELVPAAPAGDPLAHFVKVLDEEEEKSDIPAWPEDVENNPEARAREIAEAKAEGREPYLKNRNYEEREAYKKKRAEAVAMVQAERKTRLRKESQAKKEARKKKQPAAKAEVNTKAKEQAALEKAAKELEEKKRQELEKLEAKRQELLAENQRLKFAEEKRAEGKAAVEERKGKGAEKHEGKTGQQKDSERAAKEAAGQAREMIVFKGFALCIDCAPVKPNLSTDGRSFVGVPQEILAAAHAEVCKKFEVEHYRFVEYGKGPAALSRELDRMLTANPVPDGFTLLVDSRDQMTADCLSVFIRHAGQVYRGF